MKYYLELATNLLHREAFDKIDQQLSDSLARKVSDSLLKPSQRCEFSNSDSFICFDDVRRIFAMYEQALRLKENLITNLLEENERLKKENLQIPILEDKIKFLEEHPTVVYNYNAPHYQADKIEKHSDIEIGSMNVSQGGVGINYCKPTPTPQAASATSAPQPPTSSKESASSSTTQKICCFIIKGAADRIYSCDDQEFNERLRAATRGGAKDLVDYLIRHENMKIMDFLGNKAKGIYNELTACFGTLGYQYQMFQRECSYRSWKVG